jgi:UTP--glucose-1-phosphate uridylyltransferase
VIQSAVVPVAGLGTRLLPATKSQPKEMLPVARKPIVQYVVEELVSNGIEQVLFVTGRSKASIENHFDHDPELFQALTQGNKHDLLRELEFEALKANFFYTRQRFQRGAEQPGNRRPVHFFASHFRHDPPREARQAQ